MPEGAMTAWFGPLALAFFSQSMSSSQPASNSQSYSLGVDPSDAFDIYAFHSPTVCSRCFSLIRRYDTFRPDAGGGVSKYAPEERCVRAFDGEHGYKHENFEHDEYGYRPFHRPRTFCSECGSQSGRASDDDISRRRAVVFAGNLVNRLREGGIAVSDRTLKYLVGKFKSDERLDGVDTEIYRRSVKIAVRRARER